MGKQLIQGHTRVYCGGKFTLGPDSQGLGFIVVLIPFATILYGIQIAPHIWTDTSPALPILSGVFFVLAYACMLTAALRDPGIIRRSPPPPVDALPDLYKEWEINGVKFRTRWCETCNHYRPPRAVHCAVCNQCIREFDHHCPWLSHCIGARNYAAFFWFLICITIFIALVGAQCIIRLAPADSYGDLWAEWIVVILAGLFILPVGLLAGLHIMLTVRNETTNEYYLRRYQKNPFDYGFFGNIKAKLFSKKPPKDIRWKQELRAHKNAAKASKSGQAEDSQMPTEKDLEEGKVSGGHVEIASSTAGSEQEQLSPSHLDDSKKTPSMENIYVDSQEDRDKIDDTTKSNGHTEVTVPEAKEASAVSDTTEPAAETAESHSNEQDEPEDNARESNV
eukprot:Clim_evm42s207 gene=Clim_evmTU42s207